MTGTSRRTHCTAGFTLVETLLSAVAVSLIFAIIAWATLDAARLARVVLNSATLQSDGRLRLETFVQDVHDSSAVLASATINGVVYNSNTANTVVLYAPAFTSSNTPIAGQYDTIVWHLSGSAAPYTLNRLVQAAIGSSRTTTADTIMARNVSSVQFICVADEVFTATGGTSFNLHAQVYGSGSGLVEAVADNGTSVALGSGGNQAQFTAPVDAVSPWTLQFNTAPTSGDTIDTVFSVDPGSASAQSVITGVTVDLLLSNTDQTLGGSATQVDEISGRANLHNH